MYRTPEPLHRDRTRTKQAKKLTIMRRKERAARQKG